MIDKEIICNGSVDMVETAHQTIYELMGKLKYVNLKYKCTHARESTWLYNVDFGIDNNKNCVIHFLNSDHPPLVITLNDLEYLKLRPYYIATCVGFKNIIFYSSDPKGEQQ